MQFCTARVSTIFFLGGGSLAIFRSPESPGFILPGLVFWRNSIHLSIFFRVSTVDNCWGFTDFYDPCSTTWVQLYLLGASAICILPFSGSIAFSSHVPLCQRFWDFFSRCPASPGFIRRPRPAVVRLSSRRLRRNRLPAKFGAVRTARHAELPCLFQLLCVAILPHFSAGHWQSVNPSDWTKYPASRAQQRRLIPFPILDLVLFRRPGLPQLAAGPNVNYGASRLNDERAKRVTWPARAHAPNAVTWRVRNVGDFRIYLSPSAVN